MGRHKDLADRVLGPRYDASKDLGRPGDKPWYLIFIEGGKREKQSYPTAQAAAKALAGYKKTIAEGQQTTVADALMLYEHKFLRALKKNLTTSAATTMYRLNLYFGPVLKMPLAGLDEAVCRELREGKWRPGSAEPMVHGLATRKLKHKEASPTPTSQLNIIAAARTFTKRLHGAGVIKVDPMKWYDPDMEPTREKGSKGQARLSFSQAERVLLTALEVAQKEAGRTEIGDRAACTFLMLMTGLRASTVAGLKVGSVDRRRGEAAGERWILTAPQAKKRGGTVMRPYGLTAVFEDVLGPLCEGRPADAPLFPTRAQISPQQKAVLAAQYSALDQSKTREATERRRAWLRDHGSWRQQINRWQRGDYSEDELRGREGGHHGRDWIRRSVAKICILAGVPVETAHGLRGALASKLTSEGYADVAQWLLNHVHRSTTEQSYAGADAVALGKTRQFMGLLKGGKA